MNCFAISGVAKMISSIGYSVGAFSSDARTAAAIGRLMTATFVIVARSLFLEWKMASTTRALAFSVAGRSSSNRWNGRQMRTLPTGCVFAFMRAMIALAFASFASLASCVGTIC